MHGYISGQTLVINNEIAPSRCALMMWKPEFFFLDTFSLKKKSIRCGRNDRIVNNKIELLPKHDFYAIALFVLQCAAGKPVFMNPSANAIANVDDYKPIQR